jgi:integrase
MPARARLPHHHLTRRRDPGPKDGLVFCGPGGSNRVPRGTRSELSVGNYRRVYERTAAWAGLKENLDLRGPHDLRHTYATWLEDSGVPARVIDELMGHHGGRRRDGDGSAIGLRYRHMTAEMQARIVAVIDRHLAAAQKVLRSLQ